MTRVTFREGDIVGVFRDGPDRQSGVDIRVVAILDGERDVMCETAYEPGCKSSFRSSDLRLLRRPVRVGDMIAWSIMIDSTPSPNFAAGLAHVTDPALHTIARHADGTTIEPPKVGAINPPEAATPPAPLLRAENVRQTRRKCSGCGLNATHGIATFDNAETYCVRCITEGPAVLLPEHHIAHAIWETDPRVEAFLERVADEFIMVDGKPVDRPEDGRFERAQRVAWERDEGGWRSDAEKRASRIRAVLLQSALPKE